MVICQVTQPEIHSRLKPGIPSHTCSPLLICQDVTDPRSEKKTKAKKKSNSISNKAMYSLSLPCGGHKTSSENREKKKKTRDLITQK